MKEIKAFIHRHRIAAVIEALAASNQDEQARCRNICVLPVESLLKPVDAAEQHYSMDLAQPIIHEYKLELLCEDDQVDALVASINRLGQTGQQVAGWIFVTEITRAIPIVPDAESR